MMKFLLNLETIVLIIVTGTLIIPLVNDIGKVNPSYTVSLEHVIILVLIMAFYLVTGIYIGKHKK